VKCIKGAVSAVLITPTYSRRNSFRRMLILTYRPMKVELDVVFLLLMTFNLGKRHAFNEFQL
jgi:hypothetical protein